MLLISTICEMLTLELLANLMLFLVGTYAKGSGINFAGMPLYYLKFLLHMGYFELVDLVES